MSRGQITTINVTPEKATDLKLSFAGLLVAVMTVVAVVLAGFAVTPV